MRLNNQLTFILVCLQTARKNPADYIFKVRCARLWYFPAAVLFRRSLANNLLCRRVGTDKYESGILFFSIAALGLIPSCPFVTTDARPSKNKGKVVAR